MGKKTYVNAVTERLLDTDNFRSSTDLAQQRYVVAQRDIVRPSMRDDSFTDFLLLSHKSSMVTKFRNAYNYAKDKSRYHYGLPTSALTSDKGEDLEILYENYLNKVEKGGVTLLKDRISPKNLHFFAWLELYEKYQYSGVDNSIGYLSIREGATCYLESAILTYSAKTLEDAQIDNNLDSGGLSFNYGECFDRPRALDRIQEQTPIENTVDSLIVSYAFDKGKGVQYKSMTIDLSHIHPTIVSEVPETVKPNIPKGLWGANNNSNVYAIKDTPDESEWIQLVYLKGNEVKLFKYAYLSGSIPELDVSLVTKDDNGQYFPRIYIKDDGQLINSLSDSAVRKKDTKNMLRKLDLNLGELNDMVIKAVGGDNKEFQHIFIHLTVSVNKDYEDNTTAKYLYAYMDRLYGLSKPEINNSINLPNSRGSMYQEIRDTTYMQSISYNGIAKEVKQGKLKNSKGVNIKVGEYITDFKIDILGSSIWKKNIKGLHTFSHQVSSDSYVVITVMQLAMRHHISNKTISEELDSEQLSLPLDNTILKTLNFKERDELMNRALQITVLSKKVVKEKWYQKGAFKIVVAIVSIAINFVVPGSGFTMMALLEAVAVSIITTLAINAAIGVLIDIAISLGLSPELLAIVTGVAIMVAAGYGAGKIDFTKAFNAKDMLLALNKTFESYQKGIANSISNINKEMKEFAEYNKERNEVLKTAQEMLNTGVIPANLEMLTNSILTTNYLYLGETPEEFYTRTTTTDVTDMTVNMVEYFHDMTTSLPKPGMVYVRETEDVNDVLLIN